MTISYNWLSEYLPEKIEPGRLSEILTSIGLEVESMTDTGEAKGRLKGLVVGEVLTCEKHPGADKLKLTTVSVGGSDPLKIVCGAPNVAAGQKVIVATIGSTLHPAEGQPFEIKKAKSRGEESEGMLCSESEIGIGKGHDGITILPADLTPGMPFADFLIPQHDIIFEIGLTPNRMDAMSHLGVARDVCAYLSHHGGKAVRPLSPLGKAMPAGKVDSGRTVDIADADGCKRYCGIRITGISVKESPAWLQQRLQSIGLRPINNIVDITNFILHETGQPLHAFDDDKIIGGKIIIKTLPAGTVFRTLDNKERKLAAGDLMICNEKEAMCMAGVYGGLDSGVTEKTNNIFLESAWFNPSRIRRTSMHHALRTDAATRFEKGCNIGLTADVLKRAALLITEIAGGSVMGDIVDVYPTPAENTAIDLTFEYVRKLSGKSYERDVIRNILTALDFTVISENETMVRVKAPLSKTDIHHSCDIVEEIMRIDGLDNVAIPSTISLAPSLSSGNSHFEEKEKIADLLASSGFYEILTNSISNSRYYEDKGLVKMINSLSADLDVLRPSLLESGLQVIGFNLNRKNNDLKCFEFGKIYHKTEDSFMETPILGLWLTGSVRKPGWKEKETAADFFYLKGILSNICRRLGCGEPDYQAADHRQLTDHAIISLGGRAIGHIGSVQAETLKQMDIKAREVWYAEIQWNELITLAPRQQLYREISRFPAVERDLALVVDRKITYSQMRETAVKLKLTQLKSIHLFDLFESDKLGTGKKSLAMRFVFQDQHKTLTDQEIEIMMNQLVSAFEKTVNAEIRK